MTKIFAIAFSGILAVWIIVQGEIRFIINYVCAI
jgi:hypothetical protein